MDATQPSNHPAARTLERDEVIRRHTVPVRIWHWVNALCILLLLMSGLEIFNWGAFLAWGEEGHPDDLPVLATVHVTSLDPREPHSTLVIGTRRFDTSGILGVPRNTHWGVMPITVPMWLTFPGAMDLQYSRGWHFLLAWIFLANLAIYVVYGVLSRHFWRDFLPSREQLRPRRVIHDLLSHIKLRRARGEEARRYNLLQKLAYSSVIFVAFPMQILSGLTMANGVNAAWPWLFHLFGGRQSARTVHFICAVALLLFVLIHVFQVFVAGFGNHMRSMVSGTYRVEPEEG